MKRTRKAFIVYVDLDPVPGAFHTQESAQMHLSWMLREALAHYNPLVSIAPNELQPKNSPLLMDYLQDEVADRYQEIVDESLDIVKNIEEF